MGQSDMQPADFNVILSRKHPVQQVPMPLDELMEMLQPAANDGGAVRHTQIHPAPPVERIGIDDLRASLMRDVEQRLASFEPPVPHGMREAQQRIEALERRLLSDGADDLDGGDDAAGLAARFAPRGASVPRPQPPADHVAVAALGDRITALERAAAAPPPHVPDPRVEHAIANPRQQMDGVEAFMRAAEAPTSKADRRAVSIEAVRRASDQRRRLAMPGGDLALAVKLAEVAHLARAGQEGPMTLMATIAEANGNGAWQEAAADLVVQADSLARICVRTYAVEMVAISGIEQADGDMIETIATGATAALAAIQG